VNRQELAATERWLLAQELLSQVRHPLRNKLGSVRNAAFFIRRSLEKSGMPTDPRVASFLKLIDEELHTADRQLTSGFGGTRESASPRSRTQLSECIDGALVLRAPPAGVSISVQCAEDPTLWLNAGEVIVALGCLLDNACESIAGAGEIKLSTSTKDDCVAVAVSDSGGGFSADSAEHAFDAFYSTKPGHLGLGLNLVQRILADYGGRAVLDSSVRGANLTVLLPRALAKPEPQLRLQEPP
jgi:signal transduction histidine kinase